MNNLSPLLHQWILGLIAHNVDYSSIHNSFQMEDGMTLVEYITYEQEQFTAWSSIHDVTTQFSIQILAQHPLSETTPCDKYAIFFYIINHLGRIVCKMSMTVVLEQNQYYIGSNNFYTQLVPKYSLQYFCSQKEPIFTHLALAIKSPLLVQQILCTRHALDSFSEGSNFAQDSFYQARFLMMPQTPFNAFHTFRIAVITPEGQTIIEKRVIFFDQFRADLIPFYLENHQIMIQDMHYPVHLSYWVAHTHINYNHEYPRSLGVPTAHIDRITITDCLENDWSIIL